MCLTLANAATIHHHTDPTGTAVRGYTATTHHAGHLTPGDQWRPLPDQPPRTVTDLHRRHGVIVLTDQYGSAWTYPATSVIPTAVPDPPAHPHLDHGEQRHPMTTTTAGRSARPAPITGHHARPPPAAAENPDDTPMTPPGPGGGIHSH